MYLSKLTRTPNPDGTVTLTGPCFVTKQPYSVTVPAVALAKYESGTLAQVAFPMLSRDEREFLISGTSPDGWRELFG